MGDKGLAYVLKCGCRFFGGNVNASMCDVHRFERRQARQDAGLALFLLSCLVGLILGMGVFSGCAVDMGGIDDANAMVGKVRGADSGDDGVDSGAGVLDAVSEDAATMEADGASSDVRVDLPPSVDVLPDMEAGSCPKSPPVNGCAPGTLSFPAGPVECCVPVDWEGYRVHCPQPVAGCRWRTGSFDGWAGECCA